MVEHRLAVARDPNIALQAGGSEPQAEKERFDRVFSSVRSGTSVSEGDRLDQ